MQIYLFVVFVVMFGSTYSKVKLPDGFIIKIRSKASNNSMIIKPSYIINYRRKLSNSISTLKTKKYNLPITRTQNVFSITSTISTSAIPTTKITAKKIPITVSIKDSESKKAGIVSITILLVIFVIVIVCLIICSDQTRTRFFLEQVRTKVVRAKI